MSQVISSKDDWYVNIDNDDEQEEKEERKRASSSSPSPNNLQHMSATKVSKSKKSQQQNSTVVANKYASEDNVLITFKQKQVYTQDLDKEVSLFTWIFLWLAYVYNYINT
jgi:hypothetical protein